MMKKGKGYPEHVKNTDKSFGDPFAQDVTDREEEIFNETGLDIKGEDHMIPLKWEDWISLPYDENSSYIRTVNLQIKIPKIIVLCKFDRVPFKRPKFTTKNLWIRDGATCQYTGKKLTSKKSSFVSSENGEVNELEFEDFSDEDILKAEQESTGCSMSCWGHERSSRR